MSTLLAEWGGEAAGMATVAGGTEPGEAWLFGVWVAPAMRGRGVGDALMAGAIEEARRAGAARLLLEVGDWNAAARGLYGRHGFAATGKRSTLPPPREHMIELEFAVELR